MMRHDGAALRVLYIGGTGTISTSCVRLSVESGMSVFVLNRGNNSAARGLPEGVTWLTGDVTDDASLLGAIGDQCFDAVVNFLARLVHVASELFPVVAPDWFWSGEVLGDIGHTGVFDTSKSGGSYPGSRRG
jgi:UDP-glucose 4-epimerase